MRPEKLEKVLGKLAVSDKCTIVLEKQPDGKIRVTSGSWNGEKVIMRDQVLEVRNANSDGRPHIARKLKTHDEWDPPVEVYEPDRPGVTGNAYDVIDDCAGAWSATRSRARRSRWRLKLLVPNAVGSDHSGPQFSRSQINEVGQIDDLVGRRRPRGRREHLGFRRVA